MKKREFIRQSVILAAGAPILLAAGCSDQARSTEESGADEATAEAAAAETDPATSSVDMPYLDTIGLQLWTVRDQLAADPLTTLKTIKDLGYHQVELMDTRQAAALLPICRDLGLAVNSSFMLWTTITGRWDLVPDEKEKFEFERVLDQANEAGLSHLVFGYLPPGERENMDDYRRIADQLNRAGEQAKDRGLQMAYHNHNFEFEPMEETTPFALLTDRLDGELMPFELDVFWTAIAGHDPVELLPKLKGQIKLLHLKDLKRDTPVVTKLADVPEDAFEELGDGTLPIRKLAKMGKELGVDYCFVEQDTSPAPLESIATSLDHLRG